MGRPTRRTAVTTAASPRYEKATLETASSVQSGEAHNTPDSTVASTLPDTSRLSSTLEPVHITDCHGASVDEVAPFDEEALVLGADVNHVKEAVAAISRLRGLGLEQYRIPLPKCVVLGEQSTGKSSVIEAISGIKTPRSTDTCTRCPMFIKMEPADNPRAAWQADIYLHKNFEVDSTRMGRLYENTRRFPGWVEVEMVKEPFATVTSSEKLEELIARAQLAALAPNVDPKVFLCGSLDVLAKQYCKAQFSPNCVCVDISAPSLPPLSFYDLPGIIGQSEDAANHFLVKFVRDLVTEHIEDPDSLILVTCALSNDIHNSTAAGIARDKKATDRCIGVLTKPDCLPPGSREDKLRAVLDGRSFRLGHGYFVVKNLAQDSIDQGLTNKQARIQEKLFFSREPPWATTLKTYHDRFGTANLQTYLSKTMAAQTLNALPNIRGIIHGRLQSVESELEKIPESPTHNSIHIVFELLRNFAREVDYLMEGEHDFNDWQNCWQDVRDRFFHGLTSMKPRLRTRGQLDEGLTRTTLEGTSRDHSIILDTDDEDDEYAKVTHPTSSESPSKKRKMEMGSPGGINTPRRAQKRSGATQPAGDVDFVKLATVYKLDEIATRVRQTSKSKIPDELNPRVLQKMILETLQHWKAPLDRFLNELEYFLKDTLRNTFERHFGKWKDADIYEQAWCITEQLLKIHFSGQRHTMAAEALNDELKGPYVYHKDVWVQEKSAVHERYKEARYQRRLSIYFQELEEKTGKATTPAEREAKANKEPAIKAVASAEPYACELSVAAKVTSYYAIASRRFHDAVCMRIESQFFAFLQASLFDELSSGLQISGKEGYETCVRLLAENSARAERRAELVKEKNALLEGQRQLDELAVKYGIGSVPNYGNGGTHTLDLAQFQQDEDVAMEGVQCDGIPLR